MGKDDHTSWIVWNKSHFKEDKIFLMARVLNMVEYKLKINKKNPAKTWRILSVDENYSIMQHGNHVHCSQSQIIVVSVHSNYEKNRN